MHFDYGLTIYLEGIELLTFNMEVKFTIITVALAKCIQVIAFFIVHVYDYLSFVDACRMSANNQFE